MNKDRSSFLCACAALPAFLLLLSCPNPIDASLARKVEDQTPPAITILTPDPGVKNYFSSEITVTGIVQDSAGSTGGLQGSVQSLSYEEQYNKRIHGSTADGGVTLAEDGSFAFTFSAIDPEMLSGTQVIILTAVDWNGNSATDFVTLYDKTTGPIIVVFDHSPTDYNVYSSALNRAMTIHGRVELPTTILTWDLEPAAGPGISGQNIAWDPSTGDFQFDFNPVAAGVSGQLRFILKAFDGKDSSTVFILTDEPVAPRLTSGTVAADNASVNLVFSEGIYHTGAADPLTADFSLAFTQGSGTATNAVLTGLSGAPAGGDTSIALGLSVSGQPSGSETITVSGPGLTDRVGNPLAPAHDSLTLSLRDKTAPTVTQVSSPLPVGSAHNAGEVVPITVQFSEPVTVTPPLTLTLNMAGASAAYASGSGTSTITLNYDILATHNVDPLNYAAVTALAGAVADVEGNPGLLMLPDPALAGLVGKALRIDNIAPNAPVVQILDGGDEIINVADNLAGVAFTVTGEDGSTYDLSGSNYSLIAGSASGPLPASGSLRASGAGAFTVTVSATQTDRAGNQSLTSGSDTSVAHLERPTAPDVYTEGGNPTNSNPPTWKWTSGGGGDGTYHYLLNSVPPQEGTVFAVQFTPSALPDGRYTLQVQERNGYGNWSEYGSLPIEVDTTPPDPPSFAAAASPTNSPSWSWSSGAGGAGVFRYRLEVDDLSGQPESTDTSHAPSLADGSHTLYVQERDSVGNWSSSSHQLIVVDTDPPGDPTITGPATPTGDNTPTWTWQSNAAEPGNGTFHYLLDSSPPQEGTVSAAQYTSSTVPNGTYTLQVQERDEAGNWSGFASRTITIE